MKKLLFSLTLLLGGIIGFVGWSIAVTQTVQAGATSGALSCFNDFDFIILLIFMIMASVGLILSIKEVRTDEK